MTSAADSGRPVLNLALTGPFALSGPKPIAITAKKNRAVLAVLALSPGLKATRQRICGLLWCERPEDQARSSLRQSLAVLRKELGGHADVLVTRDDAIGLDASRINVDVLRFAALAGRTDVENLSQAAELLSGELLADTMLKEAGFAEWLDGERRSLAAKAIGVFERLAVLAANPRRIEHARRLVDLDPLRESAHRALMQAFADSGDRAQALRQFDHCRGLLRKELDVEPSPKTSDLRRSIAGAVRDLPLTASANFVPGPTGGACPVIAVLPFLFSGEDDENGYIAEGIVEDVTAELSRHGGLSVIASSSSGRYSRSGDTAAAFASKLGASHVVTGSLRIAGENWRIAVDLTETETSRNLWSERYELRRSQFESALAAAASAIAAVVENRVAASGAAKAARKPIANWSAFDHYLRGRALCLRYAETEAVPHLDRSVDLDPELAPAFAWRALAYVGKFYENYDTSGLAVAEESAKRAIALDNSDPRGHHALGLTRLWQRRHALAGEHYDMGLALNPADLLLGYDKANWLTYTGYPQAAWDMLGTLRRRDPFPPAYVHELIGRTLFQLGRYTECIASFDKLATDHYWQHGWLAVAKAKLGRLPEARQHAQRMLQMKPGANLSWFKRVFGFQSLDLCTDAIEGLKLAGVVDEEEIAPDAAETRGQSRGAAAAGAGHAGTDADQRPLIVVRPFEGGAADGVSAFLAPGVAADLVGALSRFSEVEVAQTGNAARRGQKCFTLSGSVRWFDRVRVAVELTDETGRVVWAQRYDRAPGDIFAIQDEIVEACVYNLVNVVNRKTLDEVKAGRGNSVSAYQLFLQGRSHAYRLNRDDLFKARALLGDAIKADPEFAPAHAWLSEVHWVLWWGGIVNGGDAPELALACARLAVNLDSDDQHGLAELGQALFTLGRFDEARIALDRAMACNPNNPDVLTIVSYFKLYGGDAAGALDLVRKTMRLDPTGHYGLVHGIVLYALEEWAPAIVNLRMVRAQLPAVNAWLALSLAMAGQAEEANTASADLRRDWSALHGNAPVAALLLDRHPFRAEADRARLRTGLVKAGLDGGPAADGHLV